MQWIRQWLDRTRRQNNRRNLANLPSLPASTDIYLGTTRFVVLDVESTGLSPQHDALLSLGAVAVHQQEINLADQFDAIFAQAQATASASILLHGLGPDALAQGQAAAQLLPRFYQWAQGAVLVAFHAGFDRALLEKTCVAEIGFAPPARWLDLAHLLPALFPRQRHACQTLDDWLAHFGLSHHARHEAAADAWVSAELLLIALHAARQQGLHTLAELERKIKLYRQLQDLQPF